jgi:hypothetical protein
MSGDVRIVDSTNLLAPSRNLSCPFFKKCLLRVGGERRCEEGIVEPRRRLLGLVLIHFLLALGSFRLRIEEKSGTLRLRSENRRKNRVIFPPFSLSGVVPLALKETA